MTMTSKVTDDESTITATDPCPLMIQFTSPDPRVSQALQIIRDLSPQDPVRQECEAVLYTQLARDCWREANRLRRMQRMTA